MITKNGQSFKVKDMRVATGGALIVVINIHDAPVVGVHALDRILVRCGAKKTVAVVDIAQSEKTVPIGSVGLFDEVLKKVGARHGSRVHLDFAKKPQSLDAIKKKLDGGTLKTEETYAIIKDVVNDELTEQELSYFVAASYCHGMTLQETIDLTRATVDYGEHIDSKNGAVLDKHCIGGVPNNRTTMILVPIIIAAGLRIPKTSSRSITSPAGTADTMEVLAPVTFPLEKMERMVKSIGGFIAWGGAVSLAAADDKLIKVRHTLSLDPEGMLLASILAKKAAVGATHVLIDIPVGKDTKVKTHKEAIHLNREFHRIGKRLGMNIRVMISRGEEPIGNGIGPALEARDVMWILKRDPRRPHDLEHKSVTMAGLLLDLAGLKHGRALAQKLLDTGEAYTAMKSIIKAQGGNPHVNPDRLPIGKYSFAVKAPKTGRIVDLNTALISSVARAAGAPRDKGAGMYLNAHEGDTVKKGDVLFTLYADSEKKLQFAKEEYSKSKVIVIV